MRSRKGFTMIELLVVLLIIGILAAVAAPLYFSNVHRARASEAVAVMSQIRQAEREYYVRHNSYLIPVAADEIPNDPEDATPGLGVDTGGVTQYFSRASFSVAATDGGSMTWTPADAQDFLIIVDGAASLLCGTAPCAVKAGDVAGYDLEMDNSGTVRIDYGDDHGERIY